jgi:hypothetical protein
MDSTVINRSYHFDNLTVAVGIDSEGNRRISFGGAEQAYREFDLTRLEAFCLGAALYDEFMKFDKAYVGIEPT